MVESTKNLQTVVQRLEECVQRGAQQELCTQEYKWNSDPLQVVFSTQLLHHSLHCFSNIYLSSWQVDYVRNNSTS